MGIALLLAAVVFSLPVIADPSPLAEDHRREPSGKNPALLYPPSSGEQAMPDSSIHVFQPSSMVALSMHLEDLLWPPPGEADREALVKLLADFKGVYSKGQFLLLEAEADLALAAIFCTVEKFLQDCSKRLLKEAPRHSEKEAALLSDALAALSQTQLACLELQMIIEQVYKAALPEGVTGSSRKPSRARLITSLKEKFHGVVDTHSLGKGLAILAETPAFRRELLRGMIGGLYAASLGEPVRLIAKWIEAKASWLLLFVKCNNYKLPDGAPVLLNMLYSDAKAIRAAPAPSLAKDVIALELLVRLIAALVGVNADDAAVAFKAASQVALDCPLPPDSATDDKDHMALEKYRLIMDEAFRVLEALLVAPRNSGSVGHFLWDVVVPTPLKVLIEVLQSPRPSSTINLPQIIWPPFRSETLPSRSLTVPLTLPLQECSNLHTAPLQLSNAPSPEILLIEPLPSLAEVKDVLPPRPASPRGHYLSLQATPPLPSEEAHHTPSAAASPPPLAVTLSPPNAALEGCPPREPAVSLEVKRKRSLAKKIVQGRAAQGRAAQGRIAQGRAAQGRIAQGRITQGRVAQGRIAQGRAASPKGRKGAARRPPILDAAAGSGAPTLVQVALWHCEDNIVAIVLLVLLVIGGTSSLLWLYYCLRGPLVGTAIIPATGQAFHHEPLLVQGPQGLFVGR